MVGLGLLMILLALCGVLLRRGDRVYRSRAFLRFALVMGPSGLIAILAGWYTTEIGRQPWIVYGLMRTADGVSAHNAAEVGFTLAAFVVVYLVVFGAGTLYALRLIAAGPKSDEAETAPGGGPGRPRQPMRPMSAAHERAHASDASPEARS
jgi:cytochrome d ubiquinol oxidase subunit I